MALITEKIQKNAEICRSFVGGTLTDMLNKIDKNSVMNEELEAVVKSVTRIAPYREDFEKVYGADPYTFFMKEYKR